DNEPLERALAWMGQKFSPSRNPVPFDLGMHYYFYYMYGVERVGRLTGRRFLGRHDWYREGAEVLVQQQDQLRGLWRGQGGAEGNPIIATSFALLFLAKGRRPVLIAQGQHDSQGDWNHHRSAVAHLTRRVEQRWKRELSWQSIDLRTATVEDLLQAPVLLISGRDGLSLAKQQKETLRQYVEQGGFIFAEAACGGRAFDRDFRKLVAELFPDSPLRLLPPEHPVWWAEEPIPPKYLRPMLGIEFGCRTSVVYLPNDSGRPALSCLWELAGVGRENYTSEVQAQIDAALGIGVNILAYATDRKLEYKYAFFRSAGSTTQQAEIRRNALAVASLRHPGGCTVAPRALPNLLRYAEKELHLRVRAVEDELDITDPALFDHHLAFMHGRNGFRLTEAERKQLRTFVERGGTILGDAVCANQAFASSFAQEMSAIFPEHPLEPIPPDDPLLSTAFGGFDLRQVTRRDPQPGRSDEAVSVLERKVPPELLGIRIGDRWGVIFSPYDLSCALEKQNSVECRGYTTDDAARIGLNCILYAIQK
ncbi:MAG: DUF4159 domain-containing protein, partial [Planctomycetota bacterium]